MTNWKGKRIISGVIVVLIAGMIIYPKIRPYLRSGAHESSAAAMHGSASRKKLNVSGYIIKAKALSEMVRSTGTLKPDEEVDLSFETSGKIISIKFKEGSRVRKGDLLAKINDLPLQAQLQKLEVQYKLSKEKESRHRALLGKDAISQESYDQIVTELQTTEADINLIHAHIAETELRAPFDGIIGLRFFSEGAYVTPSTVIARLIKINPLKIEFSIPERYASQVRPGFPVSFMVDGSKMKYPASVYAVDPKVNVDTRTITIRALYSNENEELKPGRYAAVTLQMSRIEDAIAIPSEALIPEMDGEKVFVFHGGKASSVRVNTGLRTESEIQIVNGLNFGDTLLVTGMLQLRESLPVKLDTVLNTDGRER